MANELKILGDVSHLDKCEEETASVEKNDLELGRTLMRRDELMPDDEDGLRRHRQQAVMPWSWRAKGSKNAHRRWNRREAS